MALASLFTIKEASQLSVEGVRRALQKQRFGDKGFLATNQGLGIILDTESPSTGYKYVRRIVTGSPAAECGSIRVGDRVLEINGQDVSRLNIKECGVLVSECDKSVTILLSRKIEDLDHHPHNRRQASTGSALVTPLTASAVADVFSSSHSPKAASPSSAASASSTPLSVTPPTANGRSGSPHLPRLRSDSEASDSATVSMADEERLSPDGRVEFTVLLEKGKVVDENEELLQRVLYTKGHLSFIKGKVLGNKINFDARWVAVRHGRLIVTKGRSCVITKSVDLSKCKVSNLLPATQDGINYEFYIGIKYPGRATMYFGDRNRENIEKLLIAIKGPLQCESSAVGLGSSPAGFCSARMPLPINEYISLLD